MRNVPDRGDLANSLGDLANFLGEAFASVKGDPAPKLMHPVGFFAQGQFDNHASNGVIIIVRPRVVWPCAKIIICDMLHYPADLGAQKKQMVLAPA